MTVTTIGPGGRTRVISRAEWGARPPKSVNTNIDPDGNTAHWEGPALGDYDHASCPAKVRGIQAYHMDAKKWADGAYSSIVCRHGYVYELRWLGVRTAAQGTNDGNYRSYAHCVLMGQGDTLTDAAKRALSDVFWHFEGNGSGAEHWCHSDWHSTQCPGPVCTFVRGGLIVPGGDDEMNAGQEAKLDKVLAYLESPLGPQAHGLLAAQEKLDAIRADLADLRSYIDSPHGPQAHGTVAVHEKLGRIEAAVAALG